MASMYDIPELDTKTLGELGSTFKTAQEKGRTLAALQKMARRPDGTFDYGAGAASIIENGGDPQQATTLARLAEVASQNQYARQTDTRDFNYRQGQDKIANDLRQQFFGVESGLKAEALRLRGAQQQVRQSPQDSALFKIDAEELKNYNEAANDARGLISDVGALREARKGVGYAGQPLAQTRAAALGALGYGQGQTVDALSTKMKLNLSKDLKGAISDKEQAMLQSATPGLSMSDDAAQQILDATEAAAKRKIERAQFSREYLERNKTLRGSDETWNKYIEENPILNKSDNGGLSINQKAIGSWKNYLGSGQQPQQPAQQNLEGRTATGANGQKLIFKGGKWLDAGQGL